LTKILALKTVLVRFNDDRHLIMTYFLGRHVYLVECLLQPALNGRVRVRARVRIRFSVWLCYFPLPFLNSSQCWKLSASEMTHIVSGGALNSTRSLMETQLINIVTW